MGILLVLFACHEEEVYPETTPLSQQEKEPEGKIVRLGEQLQNPYSVENMKKALEKLQESLSLPKVSGDQLEIEVTHLYLKFKPKNEEELNLLSKDSTLDFYPYPLDYEIKQQGDYYRDPEVSEGQPTYQYVAVKADQQLPEGVAYEVLEELYIPDEYKIEDESHPNGRTVNGKKVNDNLVAALVFQSMEMTGNLSEEDKEKVQEQSHNNKNARTERLCIFGSCKPKWRPSGRIRVWDDDYGQHTTSTRVFSHWEYYNCGGGSGGSRPISISLHRRDDDYDRPSRAARVRPSCRRAVYRYVRNTVYGSYRSVEGVHVRARRWFTTHNGYTDGNGNYSCDGRFKNSANYSISWERHHFQIRTHTISVLNIFKARYNGPKKTGDWNVNIRSGTQKFYAHIHRAAFHYYYQDIKGLRRPPMNNFLHTQMKIAALAKTGTGKCHMWTRVFLGAFAQIKVWDRRPSRQATSRELYATTIHELAHASHWDMGHEDYNYTHDVVQESWARGVQWELTRMIYPSYKGGDYHPTEAPDYTQVVVDMIDDPAPLGINGNVINQNNGSEEISQDNVSGYTIRQIEDALRGRHTWGSWKENIKRKYNNGTKNNLDALFNHWH